jgi:hypothetical protein
MARMGVFSHGTGALSRAGTVTAVTVADLADLGLDPAKPGFFLRPD